MGRSSGYGLGEYASARVVIVPLPTARLFERVTPPANDGADAGDSGDMP